MTNGTEAVVGIGSIGVIPTIITDHIAGIAHEAWKDTDLEADHETDIIKEGDQGASRGCEVKKNMQEDQGNEATRQNLKDAGDIQETETMTTEGEA